MMVVGHRRMEEWISGEKQTGGFVEPGREVKRNPHVGLLFNCYFRM